MSIDIDKTMFAILLDMMYIILNITKYGDYMKRTLGDFIKEYRNNNHISIRDFAEQCGISKAYVSILENDRNPATDKPTIPTLGVILDIFDTIGISVADFKEQCEDSEYKEKILSGINSYYSELIAKYFLKSSIDEDDLTSAEKSEKEFLRSRLINLFDFDPVQVLLNLTVSKKNQDDLLSAAKTFADSRIPVMLKNEFDNNPAFQQLVIKFNKLNNSGQQKVADYASDLVDSGKYQVEQSSQEASSIDPDSQS